MENRMEWQSRLMLIASSLVLSTALGFLFGRTVIKSLFPAGSQIVIYALAIIFLALVFFIAANEVRNRLDAKQSFQFQLVYFYVCAATSIVASLLTWP